MRSFYAKKESGFTLIELLVVIAIIGLMSTIAVVALNGARQKSRDTKRVADVRQMLMSLELYNNDNNGYPVEGTPVELGQGEYAALCLGGFKDVCDPGEQVFQGILPSAPTPWDGNCSEAENQYMYSTPSGEFQIEFCLGAGVGQLTAGTHTATPSGIE